VAACGVHGAAPPLDGFFPAGAARGTTHIVTAAGKFDSWPAKVWVSGAGVNFTAETNKGKFQVTIASNAAAGVRLVRLYNEDGASNPRMFVVGSGRELVEAEPNNHFSKAEPISDLPVTINGRLDKNGDVDSFSLDLRAGQWLDARVDSYTLMSKVDAVLRLVTTNGEQLEWNHDFVTLDPRLTWKSPVSQRVVLQIFGFAYPPGSDIGLTGGDAVAYRLQLRVTNAMRTACAAVETAATNRDPGLIELPCAIHGTIERADQEDRFQFMASKGDSVEATVEAASLGSPLDAWMKIEDMAGKQLARGDDADGSPDPRLEWKAPTNGTYVLALGSVTHRGGNDCCYQLNVRRVGPDYRATLSENSLVLTTGMTNELKINFNRLRGFTNRVDVSVRGLPSGVTSMATNLPAKDGSASVRIIASENAPSFQGPVNVVLSDHVKKEERRVPYELTTPGETGFAHLLIENDTEFWLTVRSKQAEKEARGKK
jgi:hypothetical protein